MRRRDRQAEGLGAAVSHRWCRLLVGTLAIGWLAMPAGAADRLVTTTETLLGELVGMTPAAIEFRRQGASGRPETIPVDSVVRLSLETEPSRVTEARQLLEQAAFQAATEVISEVTPVELEVASAAVRGEYAFVKAAAAGRQAAASGQNLAAGLAAVTDFLDRFSRSIHRYPMLELAGDLELASGRPAAAIALYEELATGPPSLAIRAARLQGEALLAAGERAEAARVFASVADQPARDAASRRERAAARLGEAACLIALDRPAKAVSLVQAVVAAADPPADSDAASQRQLARAYALLGRACLTDGRDQDALIAYLTVDLVHSGDPESHAEALFRLHDLWNRGRYPQRAGEARRRLEQTYPASAWAGRLQEQAVP